MYIAQYSRLKSRLMKAPSHTLSLSVSRLPAEIAGPAEDDQFAGPGTRMTTWSAHCELSKQGRLRSSESVVQSGSRDQA
jgi:hypothetical protein